VAGTPEYLPACKASSTGQVLKDHLRV
jgi:hypothetical protein